MAKNVSFNPMEGLLFNEFVKPTIDQKSTNTADQKPEVEDEVKPSVDDIAATNPANNRQNTTESEIVNAVGSIASTKDEDELIPANSEPVEKPSEGPTEVTSNTTESSADVVDPAETSRPDRYGLLDQRHVSNDFPGQEVEKTGSSLTPENAFYIQKRAIQENTNIPIIIADILDKYYHENHQFTDAEAMKIIADYNAERRTCAKKTFVIPKYLKDFLNRQAKEAGLKIVILLNYYITCERTTKQ